MNADDRHEICVSRPEISKQTQVVAEIHPVSATDAGAREGAAPIAEMCKDPRPPTLANVLRELPNSPGNQLESST